MPTTPELGLPYPLLTHTADVPRDIKALAERLDGLLQFGTDTENPIQMLADPPADWGSWNNFPTQSKDNAPGLAYSGPAKATDWDSAPVLNPSTRWKFTAPSDGILMVNTFLHFGYNNSIPGSTGIWQEVRQLVQAVSGSVTNPWPQYIRHIFRGSAGDDVFDVTHVLNSWAIVREGSVVSPYLQWRGKIYRESTSGYRPRWNAARQQGLFIPGATSTMNVTSNNSSAKMANVKGSTTDLPIE